MCEEFGSLLYKSSLLTTHLSLADHAPELLRAKYLRKVKKRSWRKSRNCDVFVAVNILKSSVQGQDSAHLSSKLVLSPSCKALSLFDPLDVSV